MRIFQSSKAVFFVLGSLFQPSVFSAPLIIEINNGTEYVPFETGDVDQTTNSTFVQIIDVSKKRDSQLDLGEIIENNSGVKIRRLGGLGSYSSVSIRGKSSDQVMVYVDGMLVNNASGGSVDLSQIPLNQVARIEIYKDIIPVEFSEASNGGVINIITHRAKKSKTGHVAIGAGSFETLSVDVSQMAQYKKWDFVFSGGYLESKNNFPFVNENSTPNNPYDDEKQDRNNNQLDQYNALANAKYKFDHMASVKYQLELFSKDKNIPSTNNSEKTRASLGYDNIHLTVNYINSAIGWNNFSLNMSSKIGEKKIIFDDSESQIGLDKVLIEQLIQSWSNKIYIKYSGQNYQWVNSSGFRYEDLSIDDVFTPESQRSNRRISLSNAMQGSFYFYAKRLIVSPVGRFFFSADRFDGNTLTESDSSNKQYYTVTPQIGVRYQLNSQMDLKFNAGQYYRLPNYVELFGTQGFIGSNKNLEPEQGNNFDLGFEFLKYPNSIFFTKLQWNSSLFHSIINNEIVYSFDARGVGKPLNNNKSVITGIENNVLLEMDYSIELTSNTTFQRPLNRSDPNKTKLLSGRPLWSQASRVAWNENNIYIFLEHIWESAYYFDSEQRLYGKVRSIFNSGIKFQAKKLQLSLTLKNIFNHRNKDYFSQVSPGLSFFLSTMFTFD